MDDLISRKDAINALDKLPICPKSIEDDTYISKWDAIDMISDIPSVESTRAMDEAIQHYMNEGYMILDRPTGEWILEDVQNKEDIENSNYSFRCSECGYVDIHSKCVEVPYCWHCGGRMKKHE